jgi:hypothetical protein
LFGGGIFNDGTATVDDSTFSDHHVTDAGGGIFNRGMLTVREGIFSENEGFERGGGIFNNGGTVTIDKSTFSGKRSDGLEPFSPPGPSGGIFSTGPLTVEHSTVTQHTATVLVAESMSVLMDKVSSALATVP